MSEPPGTCAGLQGPGPLALGTAELCTFEQTLWGGFAISRQVSGPVFPRGPISMAPGLSTVSKSISVHRVSRLTSGSGRQGLESRPLMLLLQIRRPAAETLRPPTVHPELGTTPCCCVRGAGLVPAIAPRMHLVPQGSTCSSPSPLWVHSTWLACPATPRLPGSGGLRAYPATSGQPTGQQVAWLWVNVQQVLCPGGSTDQQTPKALGFPSTWGGVACAELGAGAWRQSPQPHHQAHTCP